MRDDEWSRSRYWLCHFLHSRHERLPIGWDQGVRIDPAARDAVERWLQDSEAGGADGRRWVTAWAARRCANDPAYVQALRLFIKEHQYHARLMARLLQADDGTETANLPPARRLDPVLTWARRMLGVRFELSVLLLSQILTSVLCRLFHEASGDPVLRDVAAQVDRDTRAHIAFHRERLTREFTAFNFVRRNLRRLRLRMMFAAALAVTGVRYRGLIRAAGWTQSRFAAECWGEFTQVLEHMVPYRRDALLAALVNQSEHPYREPHEMG